VDETTATLSPLSPSTTYTMSVRARNEVGLSDPSSELEATTTGDLVGSHPFLSFFHSFFFQLFN